MAADYYDDDVADDVLMWLVVTYYFDDDVADDVAGERVGAGRGCGVWMPLCRNLSKPLQRPF